jgi:hypothetical protein
MLAHEPASSANLRRIKVLSPTKRRQRQRDNPPHSPCSVLLKACRQFQVNCRIFYTYNDLPDADDLPRDSP